MNNVTPALLRPGGYEGQAAIVTINDQCKYAMNVMEKTSEHIFLTGKAGTGKSTLLSLFRKHTKKNVVVLAPTGIAALNVHGQTIHSFFQFKPNITLEDAKKKGQKSKQSAFFHAIDTIIIDEISMVRADLLDCIDIFLRMILKNEKPFGGKQLIAIGDLYQLAPVVTQDEQQYFKDVYTSPHFFAAHVFNNTSFAMRCIELDKVYRQTDNDFIQVLNAIRNGTPTDDHLNILNQCVNPTYTAREGDMYLTPTNAHADALNLKRLESLGTPLTTFYADIEGAFDEKLSPAQTSLTLGVGSQVMFLNNSSDSSWANGTVGKVTSIGNDGDDIIVKLNTGSLVAVQPYKWTVYTYAYDHETKSLIQEVSGSFTQYPLKLAWAITIHKSQGKTFDRVVFDLRSGAFAQGQVYVGLSRCRTIEGLILKKPLKKSDIMVNDNVTKFLDRYQHDYMQEIKQAGLEEKIKQILVAIDRKATINIEYLREVGEIVVITIVPMYVGPMFHQEKTYLGVRGLSVADLKEKIFPVTRIVSIARTA